MPLLAALCVLFEGVYFMAITKPGHVADIWTHVYRIDAMLNGDLIARPVSSRSLLHNTDNGVVGGAVDRAWVEYSLHNYDGYDPGVVLADTLHDDHTSPTLDVPFNNTATNSPVAYLPQLAGFALGRALHLDCGATYRLAEIIMLFVYALMVFCAVALLPRWRIPIGLLVCMPPMTRYAPFAISADSFTQAVILLFSCMLIRELIGRRTLRGTARLALLGLVLAMVKFIYVPLALLMIPLIVDDGSTVGTARSTAVPTLGNSKRLRVSRERVMPVVAGIAIPGIWTVFWLKVNSWYTNAPMMVSYAEMNERKHMLLTQPGVLTKAIGDVCHAIIHAQSNMNAPAQSKGIAACWAAIVLVLLALILRTAASHWDGPQPVSQADALHAHPLYVQTTAGKPASIATPWLIWLVCTGIVLLTYLALWLQYNPADNIGVDGMQYRYFLPLAALFGFVLLESIMRIAPPIARPTAKLSEK